MKNRIAGFISGTARLAALIFLTLRPSLSPAQVSVSININYNTYPGESSYYIQMPITTTNSILSYYEVISPRTNFVSTLDSVGNVSSGTYATLTQFTDLADAVTNGNWLFITDAGTPSQQTYTFQVTGTGFTSNVMPGFQVTYPMPEQAVTDPNVTFAWTNGPAFYTALGLVVHNTDYSFSENVGIDPSYYSSWNFKMISEPPLQVVNGDTNFYFDVNYETSGADYLAISTPRTTNGQTVPGGWTATSTLNLSEDNATNADGDGVHFTWMTNASSSGAGHTNLAYYSFEDDSIYTFDFSGHGNSIGGASWFSDLPFITNDAEAGAYACAFTGSGWLNPPANLVPALSQSFSVSLWAATTNNPGNDTDTADAGAGLLAANSDQVIPLALTGSKLAFLTGGGSPDTLHSSQSINTGNYVHLVVTRDQVTGIKKIYVNGILDASDYGAPGPLSTSSTTNLFIGMNTSFAAGYIGLMDEIQIYSGVLSPAEVSFLYNNPGTNVADTTGSTNISTALNTALGTTNLLWATSGDTNWFVESTNTWSTNAAAAQSGSVTNAQFSTLSVTVTGPGEISFYWSSIANDPNQGFYCEFYMDGDTNNGVDQISGDTAWSQDGPFPVPAGQHTLGWTVFAGGDTSPAQAAFLDAVSYVPDTPPVITLNPFNQTNYPGYSVALLAAASGTPAPTWQWYQVGNPDPIAGATSALFIPANSGTAAVAGSYYAVASNAAGSQTTTTALVTFASLPLPADWSEAFKSPFVNYDIHDTYVASDVYYACAVDGTGTNLFSAGYSSGANFFGTNEILNLNGEFAAFIVKQDAAKNALWVVSITNEGNGNSYAEDLAPAPGGGVYAAGAFSGTNRLGNTPLEDSGQGTWFLVSLDADGNPVWIQTASNSFPFLNVLVADPAGNVTAVIQSGGATTLGGSNLTGGTWLAQFSPGGTLNWVEPAPQPVFYLQYSAGRLYASLANGFNNGASDTIGGLTNDTDRNWTLVALNATNGQGIWLTGAGEALGVNNPAGLVDDYPQIAVSGTNLFLAGTAYGSSAVFGSFTVPIADGRGQYFARYDTNGNAQLATGFGSATTQPEAVVADADGNVYVAGNFDTYASFGNDILAAPRLSTLTNSHYGGAGYFGQAFAAKFNRFGTPLWARMAEATNLTLQVTEMVNFYDIALAPNGVWVCGEGNGGVWFGTNLVNSANQFIYVGSLYAYPQEFTSGMLGMIAQTATPASVALINPQTVGANFQFQFQSQEGFTHSILYQTNIAASNWLTWSNLPGDGTLKTISIPLSAFTPSQQGYVRLSTQ